MFFLLNELFGSVMSFRQRYFNSVCLYAQCGFESMSYLCLYDVFPGSLPIGSCVPSVNGGKAKQLNSADIVLYNQLSHL